VLQHFGVDLWVPDVGGRIDPDSDVHELMMTIFGGISKGERRRIQRRVIGAMEAATVNRVWPALPEPLLAEVRAQAA
jgi:site-specific DNA recombinase